MDHVRKRAGTFSKTYSGEGGSRSIFRSGIWEESKNPKSCLIAKRCAGQLADAQTIPARRLTTPLRLLRSSGRFLQSHISRLSPSPESVLQPSAPLPAHSLTEVLLPKWAENAVMARLEDYRFRKASRPRFTSGSYIFINFRLVKSRKQPYFKKNSAGMEDGEGCLRKGISET